MKLRISAACAFLASLVSIHAAPEAFEVGPGQKEQLPRGKEADGIIGDFLLRNDKVEAVISGNLPLRRANMSTFYGADGITPGCLYDLTQRGANNDQITIFAPAQQQGAVSWVRVVKDGRDGEAVVAGDMMNFQMAAEMIDCDNATVIVNDDVAVENSTYTTGRRGVAGTLIVEKIIGAAAERGDGLAALKALGDAVNKATASMGVALSSCTVPAAGKPTFQIGADEMEMGVGIHGEPGRRRVRLASADDIAAELSGAILKDLSLKPGQEVLLLVNGFGGTPLMELYLMVNAVRKILDGHRLKIARCLTGSYVTSLEMAGCSVTVSAMDAATLVLWDAPVHTAALRWGM